MANLNLSEFTEKLFVADADHTFIWDTAASISKRVSRNSWLNSGTLTSDAPVTISQTWGTTGTYTAAKVNVTETATANALSKLLDLQVGTVSKFAVFKDGTVQTPLISTNGAGALSLQYGASGKINCFTDLDVLATNRIAFSDTFLQRDGAANTLALRNGAAAQTFNVYGTYTSGSVYERMFMRYNGTDLAFQVGAETLGATARPLQLWTGGASRLHITSAGNVGIGTTAPLAKLHVTGGDNVGDFLTASIAFGYQSTNNFSHYLHTRHVNGNPVGNAFDFYTSSGVSAGVFPTNAVHGMTITNGSVGIGTTSPTSKLQVSAGDVEVDTIAKGVILKSPDGTRYRVTVANGGTLSVAAV